MNENELAPDDVAVPLGQIERGTTPFDDLLPASHRTSDDDIQPSAATTTFLKKELGVERLNDIHQWLWLVGRPMPPRPLHYQIALGRDIILHEQMSLHLVWDEHRIFLKPIPRYLLDQDFWLDFLRCMHRCARVTTHFGQDDKADKESLHDSFRKRIEGQQLHCDRCSLRRLANGFILTYTSLISYEHDLETAKAFKLVPSEISWLQWRQMVKGWLTPERKCDVNPRYKYGELRLGRLNQIYRFTLRSPVRGYLYGYRTYRQFWGSNTARIAAVFAYIVIVLSAMQVGLATQRLSKSAAFQSASYGFTVFSILAPLVLLGDVVVVFLGVFIFNLIATLRYRRDRSTVIDQPRDDGKDVP